MAWWAATVAALFTSGYLGGLSGCLRGRHHLLPDRFWHLLNDFGVPQAQGFIARIGTTAQLKSRPFKTAAPIEFVRKL
jgi:hypothetical protein